MEFAALAIPEVKLITPRRFTDPRGFFAETFSRRRFAEAGLVADFVQDNQSLSRPAGTVRGLHFQRPPHAQAKLVRVVRGAIFDVAVDIRPGSPTYGRHVGVELSAENGKMILIPEGFAHGFCTLKVDTEVLYKVNRDYAPAHEGGILWNDPALGISWPVDPAHAVLSERDRKLPRLSELAEPIA
ncbi:MAG TPA: dTDP-4-dehydrorhamnose 3,5-epimerase [Alphaproteobacteria bacterium]|nr:dTDP-4-dehydrorhamnose 3,5-epimerase [Alphaproteobacteria bacterium]